MDDIKRINDQLDAFPEKIYTAALRTEDLREKWLLTDARKDFEFAGCYLRCKAKDMTEGEAKQTAVQELLETTTAVITAESSFRRALADQIRLENEFTSIRKQANLIEAQYQRMGSAA